MWARPRRRSSAPVVCAITLTPRLAAPLPLVPLACPWASKGASSARARARHEPSASCSPPPEPTSSARPSGQAADAVLAARVHAAARLPFESVFLLGDPMSGLPRTPLRGRCGMPFPCCVTQYLPLLYCLAPGCLTSAPTDSGRKAVPSCFTCHVYGPAQVLSHGTSVLSSRFQPYAAFSRRSSFDCSPR